MADEAAAIDEVLSALLPLHAGMRSRVIQWAALWIADHGGELPQFCRRDCPLRSTPDKVRPPLLPSDDLR
jgi:hypothetical protein